MQGAQKLRSETHLQVRRNDEVAAQRRRWTFYEAISIGFLQLMGKEPFVDPRFAILDPPGETKNVLLEIKGDHVIGSVDLLGDFIPHFSSLGVVHDRVGNVHLLFYLRVGFGTPEEPSESQVANGRVISTQEPLSD